MSVQVATQGDESAGVCTQRIADRHREGSCHIRSTDRARLLLSTAKGGFAMRLITIGGALTLLAVSTFGCSKKEDGKTEAKTAEPAAAPAAAPAPAPAPAPTPAPAPAP